MCIVEFWEPSWSQVDLQSGIGTEDTLEPVGIDRESNPEEHVDSVVQDINAIIPQLVARATNGGRQRVVFIAVQNRH